MFGTEEEQKLSIFERQKVSMVSTCYKNGDLFFKMFFDKTYRPARYEAMTAKIDKYSNINEFRSYITGNFSNFPVDSTHNIYLFKKQKKEEIL